MVTVNEPFNPISTSIKKRKVALLSISYSSLYSRTCPPEMGLGRTLMQIELQSVPSHPGFLEVHLHIRPPLLPTTPQLVNEHFSEISYWRNRHNWSIL